MRTSFPLLLLILSGFFALPNAQARPHHKMSVTTLIPGKNYFPTTLTDHNPPTMKTEYFASPRSISHFPSVSITVEFAKPPKAGYKANQASLQFYQYVQGPTGMPSTIKIINPAKYFDLSGFGSPPINKSLKKTPTVKKKRRKYGLIFHWLHPSSSLFI